MEFTFSVRTRTSQKTTPTKLDNMTTPMIAQRRFGRTPSRACAVFTDGAHVQINFTVSTQKLGIGNATVPDEGMPAATISDEADVHVIHELDAGRPRAGHDGGGCGPSMG